MDNKDVLIKKLNEVFQEVHISWNFLKTVVDNVINKYDGKWEKECNIEILDNRCIEYFCDEAPDSLLHVLYFFKEIGIPVEDGVSFQSPILKFSIKL